MILVISSKYKKNFKKEVSVSIRYEYYNSWNIEISRWNFKESGFNLRRKW